MTKREREMTSQEREKVLVAGAVAMIKHAHEKQGIPIKDGLACFKGEAHGMVAVEIVKQGLV